MIDQLVAGRYRIDSQIGVGGMGIVYRAHDTKLRRDVALKVIAPTLVEDEEARSRFLREAQALAGLSHPNIVTVFDLSEDFETNTVFIVMELLNGLPLRKRITDPSRPGLFDMAIQVCRALENAHSHGILHRDIKPENIFVCSHGTLKLMDFGLARLVDSASVSTSGMVTGTVAYMSPEQLRGGVLDPRSDLYGLGVLLYEYLCGFTPFTSDNPGTMLLKHLTEPPPSLRQRIPGISDELDALILRLLEKDPDGRYPSALTVREALEAMQSRGAMAIVTPKTSGPAAVSTSSYIPLVAPKPQRPKSGSNYVAPPRMRRQQNAAVIAFCCLLLAGVVLAFAFGETLQKMLLPPSEQPKKTTIAKKASYAKPKPVSQRSHRLRRNRRAENAGAQAPSHDPGQDEAAAQPDSNGSTADGAVNPDKPDGSPDGGSDAPADRGGADTTNPDSNG